MSSDCCPSRSLLLGNHHSANNRVVSKLKVNRNAMVKHAEPRSRAAQQRRAGAPFLHALRRAPWHQPRKQANHPVPRHGPIELARSLEKPAKLDSFPAMGTEKFLAAHRRKLDGRTRRA